MKIVDIGAHKKGSHTEQTWAELMQAFIDSADDDTKNTVVRNMVIMCDQGDTRFSYAVANNKNMRTMIGTIEYIKNYLINIANAHET